MAILSLQEISRRVFSFCEYLFKTEFKRNGKEMLFAIIYHILPENENK
jgi:hypothetical protein